MKPGNFYQKIVENRLKVILGLIKEKKDIHLIEREIALLSLDIIAALQTRSLSLSQSCKCFRKIDYSLDLKLRDQFSEELRDLLLEGILLDELGTPYGPDINLIYLIATKILEKEKIKMKQKFIESLIPG